MTQEIEKLNNIRILFAEDSENLDVYKTVIHRLNWNGIYVSNAKEMMSTVNNMLNGSLTLDAVVSDVSFTSSPKLTAITAVREIRKVMPNVPVIFISSYVTSIIREEVRRVGAEIVNKPVDVEKLFIRLAQLIQWNRMVTKSDFIGDDRRRNSVNRSSDFRRFTDYTLSTPNRIADALKGIRNEGQQV